MRELADSSDGHASLEQFTQLFRHPRGPALIPPERVLRGAAIALSLSEDLIHRILSIEYGYVRIFDQPDHTYGGN